MNQLRSHKLSAPPGSSVGQQSHEKLNSVSTTDLMYNVGIHPKTEEIFMVVQNRSPHNLHFKRIVGANLVLQQLSSEIQSPSDVFEPVLCHFFDPSGRQMYVVGFENNMNLYVYIYDFCPGPADSNHNRSHWSCLACIPQFYCPKTRLDACCFVGSSIFIFNPRHSVCYTDGCGWASMWSRPQRSNQVGLFMIRPSNERFSYKLLDIPTSMPDWPYDILDCNEAWFHLTQSVDGSQLLLFAIGYPGQQDPCMMRIYEINYKTGALIHLQRLLFPKRNALANFDFINLPPQFGTDDPLCAEGESSSDDEESEATQSVDKFIKCHGNPGHLLILRCHTKPHEEIGIQIWCIDFSVSSNLRRSFLGMLTYRGSVYTDIRCIFCTAGDLYIVLRTARKPQQVEWHKVKLFGEKAIPPTLKDLAFNFLLKKFAAIVPKTHNGRNRLLESGVPHFALDLVSSATVLFPGGDQ